MVLATLLILSASKVLAQKELSKYGDDSVSCITHSSLYREFNKQKNYAKALSRKRWGFVYDLLTNQNIYKDGTKMMGDKIN